MNLERLRQLQPYLWTLPRTPGEERAEVLLYGGAPLLVSMDDKVLEQIANVASLPGLVGAAMTMPDAHWGYGFPIGGVAAFDAEQGGVISAGGVGFDISCGIRCLCSNLDLEDAVEHLPDRELACAPVKSSEGQRYIGAMNAAINCALANRQILTHLARSVFTEIYPQSELETLFDVSHNTCKAETHQIDGESRLLYVHRKGATRAFGPGHPMLPERYRQVGQPVVIGGSMGTGSYILVGAGENPAFASSSHGAGRAMSRHQALARWKGRALVDELAQQGILIHTRSMRGVAEEAPGAYKDVDLVAEATEEAGLARRVAFLRPKVCIKG